MRIIAVLAFLCLLVSPAFAAEVVIPWGDGLNWILDQALSVVGLVASAIVALVLGFLPPAIRVFIDAKRTEQVEQLLERAIGFGVNKVKGAVEGKTLTLEVGNEVVAQALQYAVDHGAAALIEWAGGWDKIREKIIARLPFDEDAAVE